MNPTELLSALHTAERLKDTTRHCCTSRRQPESVAGHSWRIALMAYWMRDEFPEADMDKVIRMCLIHDLGECFTGDIPTFRKTAADEADEERQLLVWVDTLPAPYDAQMRALYREMAALETTEARIYKALDKFEAVIQHNESPIDTWEPREYDLNRTYAQENAAFSPYLTRLRQAIRQETEDKIAAIDAENTRIAMSAVAPEGSEFGDKMDISDAVAAAASAQGGKIVEMYPMTNGGADAGYVVKVSASGSQGTITMMVGVDANKAITGISVISHSETSGIGTKVVGNEPNSAGKPVLDQFVGMSGSGSLVVGKNVIAVSGATVSTKGITMGANAALAAVEALG